MAGLESIALAVAHLERAAQQEQQEHSDEVSLAPRSASVNCGMKTTLLPARTGFDEISSRRVSSDSICETKTTSCLPAVTAPEVSGAAAVPTMPSDMVSLSLESLSEQEFDGPPPPPPSPTDVITDVMESDVLCGRGGETNHHPGNVKYRSLVKSYQPLYIVSKRRDKPRIAEKIVHTIRHRGGRFLKKDSNSLTWRDVGNTKAREKTSQALREGAPELRTPKGKEDNLVLPSANITMKTSTFVVPSLVERQPGDLFCSSPNKRAKFEDTEVAHIPQPALSAGQLVFSSPLSSQLKPHFISPSSFPATVSADDEDYRVAPSEDRQPTAARGPRLKVLKKRLQNDAMC